jgi:transcriptional regulator with XRE-family HTH domain
MPRCFSGQLLREKRVAAGLKPERLALIVGRSVYAIHEYERGRNLPSVPVLAAMAAALNVAIDDLFVEQVAADVA